MLTKLFDISFEKVRADFVAAALVPSLTFVLVVTLLFGPILPPGLLARLQNATLFGQEGFLLLALTLVIGFILSSMNTFIYKIFEGYLFLEHLPLARRSQRRAALRLRQLIDEKRDALGRLRDQEADAAQLRDLEDELYYSTATYQLSFPPSDESVMPTRLGNILRAAESYSSDRYGIDAVLMWPRLIHVIPDRYYDKVEQSNNGLAFLINCSLLSLILALLSALASGYQYLLSRCSSLGLSAPLYFISVDLPSQIYWQRAILYLIASGFMLLACFIFYKAALPIATQYGNMVRSTFDLFRFDLLAQLKLALPEDSDAEQDTWRKVSEFMAISDMAGPLKFEYQTSVKEDEEESASSDIETRATRQGWIVRALHRLADTIQGTH